jgi:hypothetical protein
MGHYRDRLTPSKEVLVMRRFLALLLLGSAALYAQQDSVVSLSVRCGRFIDSRERAYFGFFKNLADSEIVYLTRSTEGTYTLRFLKGTRPAADLDPATLRQSVDLIDYAEALRASRSRIDEVEDRGKGSFQGFRLLGGGVAEGELLFADVHGAVILDSTLRVVPGIEIQSLVRESGFGEGIFMGARMGAAVGIAAFGIAGAAGSDSDADLGMMATGFFSGVGIAAGLIYDLIVLAATGPAAELSGGWSPETIQALQGKARFPLGSPELKRLLGELGIKEERTL